MGMFACEQEVMGLWDSGRSIEAISGLTGKTRRYVRAIVTRYHVEREDNENFPEAARRGSQSLLTAIQRAGLSA